MLERDPARAQAALDRLKAKEGETERVVRYTAEVLNARGDHDGARRTLLAGAKQFPGSIALKVALARTSMLSGASAEGDAILREVLAKEPANLDALRLLLQARLQDGQFDLAIAAMERARTAQPADPLLLGMLSDLLVRTGDPARALRLLEVRAGQGEMTPLLLGALGRAYLASGKKDEALAAFRRQLEASPTDGPARRAVIDLLVATGQAEQARGLLRGWIGETPNSYALMARLMSLEVQDKGVDGALAAAAALRADPANMPSAALLKGDILMGAGRPLPAVEAWRDEYATTRIAALASRLATGYSQLGDDAKATAIVRDWMADHPADADAAQTLARLDLRAQRWEDAEKNLGIVLAARPDDAAALNNLAWLLQRRNDPQGLVLARRAYLQSPVPTIADTLGWILVQRGDAASAIKVLEPASRQAPEDAALGYHLARAYADAGQKEAAVAVLRGILGRPAAFADRVAAQSLLSELTPQ